MQEADWDRLAEKQRYSEHIFSPINDAPRKQLLNAIKNTKGSSVIDLGCGLGELIPHLAKRFKHVAAIDFSQEMVTQAKQAHRSKATIEHADMRQLRNYHNKFDVAVSVNSVLLPSIKDVTTILQQIHKTLKRNGTLVAVFPAMESELYLGLLAYQKELKTHNASKARRNARAIIDEQDHDFIAGTFDQNGKQKFYYEFELVYRLTKAGFKQLTIDKVFYSWKQLKPGPLYFPNEPPLWDWLVTAKK